MSRPRLALLQSEVLHNDETQCEEQHTPKLQTSVVVTFGGLFLQNRKALPIKPSQRTVQTSGEEPRPRSASQTHPRREVPPESSRASKFAQ